MDWKKTAYLILCCLCVPLVSQGRVDGAAYRAGEAKLIRVEVFGPGELRTMVENFLTEKGFALVDDDQVPTLAVTGKKQTVGPPRDCKVSYQITRATLRLPNGGTVYVFSNKSAYDYGTEDQAAASALYLLKAYLNQDDTLLARLEEITPAPYYDLALSSALRDRKIDGIMEQVTQISLRLAPAAQASPPARRAGEEVIAMKKVAAEQEVIRQQIAELAQKLQTGQAAASEEAFLRIAAKIDAAASLQPSAKPAAPCADDGGRDYAAIGAVLIRVPIAGTQRLVTGDYTVCDESGQCIYERTKDQVGIRVAGSMTRLLGSSAGDYFRSPTGYLDIEARQYATADGAIIVSNCDAESMRRLGRTNRDVFTKGRVFIVPQGPDRRSPN